MPIEDIELVHGDTDRTPYGVGTYGSRSAAIGGSALVQKRRKDPGEVEGSGRSPAGGFA